MLSYGFSSLIQPINPDQIYIFDDLNCFEDDTDLVTRWLVMEDSENGRMFTQILAPLLKLRSEKSSIPAKDWCDATNENLGGKKGKGTPPIPPKWQSLVSHENWPWVSNIFV